MKARPGRCLQAHSPPGEFFAVYLSGKDRREITPLAPDAFDDLLLWLDASTIDTDPTAGQVRADGTDLLVQQWLDLSGSGHDAIQPTASLQPFFVADGLNGRPTLEFREQRAIYVPQTSTLSPSDAFTVIAVNILTNIAEDSQTIVGDYGHSFQLHKSGPQNKIYFRVIGGKFRRHGDPKRARRHPRRVPQQRCSQHRRWHLRQLRVGRLP